MFGRWQPGLSARCQYRRSRLHSIHNAIWSYLLYRDTAELPWHEAAWTSLLICSAVPGALFSMSRSLHDFDDLWITLLRCRLISSGIVHNSSATPASQTPTQPRNCQARWTVHGPARHICILEYRQSSAESNLAFDEDLSIWSRPSPGRAARMTTAGANALRCLRKSDLRTPVIASMSQ